MDQIKKVLEKAKSNVKYYKNKVLCKQKENVAMVTIGNFLNAHNSEVCKTHFFTMKFAYFFC